ncbi:ubiquitin carboxyl-terminal hydrolase 8 [Ischnura elegans]|uniref:ubiquitin carboxyl-terminal hydrolase 8 n=1 Tax=Ischnura elegans TaxID=197161 RepID=UPI001ED86ECD|nr:ubiquitin carboxyl-terminal hydrolase 8 [Ischnura elegans]
MPVKKIKELHIASSLDELRRKTEIKDINHDVKILRKSAKHVLESAHQSLQEGDEEKSYVLFMKFVEVAMYLRNTKKVIGKEFDDLFGRQSLPTAMEILETLSTSLSDRYARKGTEEKKTIPESVVKPKLPEENGNSGENANSSTNNGASGQYHDSAVSITSLELRNLILEEKFNILLIDTRSGKDFAASHMCFSKSSMVFPRFGSVVDRATTISIPQEVIKKGLAPLSLRKELPPESISSWDRRSEFDLVVLLDWDSYQSGIKMDSSIFILKDIMDKWDINTTYKRKPVVLDGGYYDWVNTFPMLTTNPQVDYPTKQRNVLYANLNEDKYLAHLIHDDDALDDLDDVEYPAIIDSPPKPAEPAFGTLSSLQAAMNARPIVPESRPPPPLVDRSSKPSAVPTSPQKPPVALQPTLKKVSNIPPAPPNDVSQEEIPKVVMQEKSSNDSQVPSERNEPPSTENQISAREEPKDKSENAEVRKGGRFSPSSDDAPERRPTKSVHIPAVDRSLKARVLQTQIHPGAEGDPGISPSSSVPVPPEVPKPIITAAKSMEAKKIEPVRRDSVDKVNEEMKKFEPFSGDGAEENKPEKKKKGGDTWFTPLKSEPSPGSSAMKRSHSLQNVSRLNDDQECPKFNRSAKPTSKTTEIIATRRRTFDGVYGKVGRGLTGLRNLGNSCYMNSILQCINHTKSLVEYFCDGQYREDVNRGTKLRGEVAEEVAALVRALWSGEYRSIACRDLKGVVGMHKKAFAGHEQQDSHEFLTILMDWLHEDLNRASIRMSKIGKNPSNPPAQNASGPEGAERAWHDFCRQNESLVLHLFYGQQASTVCCLHCGEQSVTYEPFSNLSLPIPPNATRCSLADCMALYLKGEHISGWNCPKCKEPRDASKKFDIWILPRILVIHFKRFTSDGWCRKRQTMVDFPLEDLDASQWVGSEVISSGYNPTRRRNSVLYNLYGVSNHYGTMDGGHYTAHCKSSTFNKWFKFDDQDVSELSPSDVVSPAAYILFYSSVDVS